MNRITRKTIENEIQFINTLLLKAKTDITRIEVDYRSGYGYQLTKQDHRLLHSHRKTAQEVYSFLQGMEVLLSNLPKRQDPQK